jgi:N-methylhydantoinase A
MAWSIGIDTGGTFTDVVGLELGTGEIRTVKVPSTPQDPSQAVLAGIDAFIASIPGMIASDVKFFAHGTTVATNAVIERKGARTGLLITKGTGAVYMARSSAQPMPGDMVNPAYRKPPLLVPARLTREVDERTLFDGTVERTLDEAATLAAVRELVETYEVESLAVCYLFSFTNPAHERRTRELVRRHFPGIRVSLSSELLPIIREYRRLSTTVVDAFVGPTLETYLSRLGDGLHEREVSTRQAFIMQSNGGLMSIAVASTSPVQTLLSGPAAGVISGAYLSRITGMRNLVTFDVGGTSTDVAVIVDGQITETNSGSIAGQEAFVAMNEITTIGAGGGTIARVGIDGRLKVGPDSAGAAPGPACYGRGGDAPTVTDADLVLGYLHPSSFLGGNFEVSEELARAAIDSKIAKPLGLDLEQAAMGIVKIATSLMEGELRLRLMARGYDPREFALVAIGGAGPLHASMIARNLGIRRVIVPPYPGLGSAMGLLLTDIKHQYVQSWLRPLAEIELLEVERIFEELVGRGRREAELEGSDMASLQVHRYLDLRYLGQGYELSVPLGAGPLTEESLADCAAQFHRLHQAMFGHSGPGKPLELVNLRLTTISPLRKLSLPEQEMSAGREPTPRTTRPVYFADVNARVPTAIYDRPALRAGQSLTGPAVIEQTDSTTVLLPGQTASVDRFGNLIIAIS